LFCSLLTFWFFLISFIKLYFPPLLLSNSKPQQECESYSAFSTRRIKHQTNCSPNKANTHSHGNRKESTDDIFCLSQIAQFFLRAPAQIPCHLERTMLASSSAR
jgi:hypothetical protein